MGIRKLNTIIKQHSPESISMKNISSYSGYKFAIDCSILLYKYIYISNIENSHIIGFMNRTNYYLKYNILPVFVFDGTPPIEKGDTLTKRQLNKQKIVDKITELKEVQQTCSIDEFKRITENIEKLNNQLIYINKYHILECKELLNSMGVPYLDAPGEAEKFCVYLQKINKVDYVVTDDTDAFVFGGEKVIKMSIKNNMLVEVNLRKILSDLNMTYTEFIDFCILCGCDYAEHIYYIGPITAYNLINKHRSLEVIHEKTKYNIDFNYQNVRDIFTNYTGMPEVDDFKLTAVNPDLLKSFLLKYNLTKCSNFK